jgi:hypothetical protein
VKDLQGSLSNRYIYNPNGLPCYTRDIVALTRTRSPKLLWAQTSHEGYQVTKICSTQCRLHAVHAALRNKSATDVHAGHQFKLPDEVPKMGLRHHSPSKLPNMPDRPEQNACLDAHCRCSALHATRDPAFPQATCHAKQSKLFTCSHLAVFPVSTCRLLGTRVRLMGWSPHDHLAWRFCTR